MYVRSAVDFLMLTEDEKRGLKTPLCRTPVSELLQFAAQFLPMSKNGATTYPTSEQRSHLADFAQFRSMHDINASLFRTHSSPTLPSSSSSSSFSHAVSNPEANLPVESDSKLTASDQPPIDSDAVGDVSKFAYPPMPAQAQHISVVQERILRGSASSTHASSPQVEDVAAAAAAVESDDTQLAASPTSDVFSRERPPSMLSEADSGCSRSGRISTPRRSRVVARFGNMSIDSGSAVSGGSHM